MGTLLFAEFSHARCAPGVTKCLTLPMAANAAATPEEATRLRDDIMRIGLDEILRNCQPGRDTEVTELFGSLCGPGVVANRICKYESNLDCNYRGKNFDMKVAGACKGGLHDCGTFDSCARDAGVNSTKGAFRGAGDAVPKGGFKAEQGGAVR